jgi:uncharacterized membrane-anchored protein
MKTKLFIAFALVALMQLSLPAWQIFRYERALTQGKVFKFRTRPVDPYDAFRGRYVRLGFDTTNAGWSEEKAPQSGAQVYAKLETGADGFVKLGQATLTEPESGDYLLVTTQWSTDGAKSISVTLPFEQFYMTEQLAPKAEEVYRKNTWNRDAQEPSYAQVRVLKGVGVIEDVFIGDKPLAQAAREAK